MKNRFVIALFLIFVFVVSANSQIFKDAFLGLGMTTTKILGDNPNTYGFNQTIIGGSYNEWQIGIEARALFPVNYSKSLRVPIGIDYQFFRAYERYPYFGQSTVFTNSANVMSFYTGINYVLIKFNFAQAKLYASLEPRFSYIHNLSLVKFTDYADPGRKDIEENLISKDNAFRIGGSFKLGVEGKLRENLFINTSFGITALNLLLSDDERGELFAPEPNDPLQQQESTVGTYNLTIMLQYKLN